MLILPHPYRLRVDLHKLGKRVDQTTPDGYRPAYCHILVRELPPSLFGSGVYRRSVLADHKYLVFVEQSTALQKTLGLA